MSFQCCLLVLARRVLWKKLFPLLELPAETTEKLVCSVPVITTPIIQMHGPKDTSTGTPLSVDPTKQNLSPEKFSLSTTLDSYYREELRPCSNSPCCSWSFSASSGLVNQDSFLPKKFIMQHRRPLQPQKRLPTYRCLSQSESIPPAIYGQTSQSWMWIKQLATTQV